MKDTRQVEQRYRELPKDPAARLKSLKTTKGKAITRAVTLKFERARVRRTLVVTVCRSPVSQTMQLVNTVMQSCDDQRLPTISCGARYWQQHAVQNIRRL